MDRLLFFIIILLLGLLYFVVGYLTSRSIKSIRDYFLAGRTLSLFQMAISLIATQLGGGFILGTSKEAYALGYFGILYVLGICIGFIALASGVAARLRLFNIETTAQLFETKYGSRFLKRVASLCSILSLTGVFAAQIVGSRSLMDSLGVFDPFLFIIFWLLVIAYAMLGGLRAIVQNDIFQLSFIIVVFLGLFVIDIARNISQAVTVMFKSGATFGLLSLSEWSTLAMVPLMPALYALIEQDLAQIFFAARNPRMATLAAWCAGIFLLFFAFIPLYFGMTARILGTCVTVVGNPLVSYFDQTYPSIVVMVIIYGVLAAIISTANGVLCGISSNIVQDFALSTGSEQHKLLVSRIVMIVVGCIGLLLAFTFTDLIRLLVSSYAVPVTALFVSLMVAYYAPASAKLSSLAAYVSVFGGLGTFALLLLIGKGIFFVAELDGLIVSAGGYIIGYILDKHIIKRYTEL
jgi:solute:Na+ symporter, SSS family